MATFKELDEAFPRGSVVSIIPIKRKDGSPDWGVVVKHGKVLYRSEMGLLKVPYSLNLEENPGEYSVLKHLRNRGIYELLEYRGLALDDIDRVEVMNLKTGKAIVFSVDVSYPHEKLQLGTTEVFQFVFNPRELYRRDKNQLPTATFRDYKYNFGPNQVNHQAADFANNH